MGTCGCWRSPHELNWEVECVLPDVNPDELGYLTVVVYDDGLTGEIFIYEDAPKLR